MNFITGGFLKGYKTYILGFLVAAQAIAQWAVGDLTLVQLIEQLPEILGGLGLMSLRAGISKVVPDILVKAKTPPKNPRGKTGA